MSMELTFRKGVELREALREAFPSPTSLTQVVFNQFSLHLNQISVDDSYREVITQLILRAEEKGKTADLLMEARSLNPGNLKLLDFENKYKLFYSPQRLGAILTQEPQKFWALVDALLKLPTSNTLGGRKGLLVGIPGSLSHDENNSKLDLSGIINQLDNLGPLASGQWPLLLLIDNALHFAPQGFKEPEDTLMMVQQFLKRKYGVE